MARLRNRPRHVRGWVHGTVEDADPDATEQGGAPLGTLEFGENFVATPAGRLEVRGGSRAIQVFTTDGSTALSRMLAVAPFNPCGAIVVGHHAGSSKHYGYRMNVDMGFFTGSEATSRHDLAWNIATAARPVLAELFEKMYLADASPYADRQGLTVITGGGAVSTPSYDLDGVVGSPATAPIKAYCLESWNSVLFVAGYDHETSGEAKEMVRHSFLGRAPDAANGFDKDAWNRIGALGVPVSAMRAGKSLLLIAKPNELYRLSGKGRALPGWQYVVDPVANELGFGVANPYALAYFDNRWYGVGDAGPFISDGFEIHPLANLRRASWRKVTNLERAWVVPHPDRRVVLFGFHMTPVDTGRSATFPYVVWVWDVERETWMTDWKFSADLSHAAAVTTATGVAAGAPGGGGAPTSPPTGLTIDHASASLSTIAASWTNGDSSAKTEVWVREDGGTSAFNVEVAAGQTSATATGLNASKKHWVKVRHIKNGIPTDFTAEVAAYTKLATPTPPTLVQLVARELYVDDVGQNAGGANLLLERDSVQIHDFGAVATGFYDFNDTGLTSSQTYTYRARAFRSDWPAAIQHSLYCAEVSEEAP